MISDFEKTFMLGTKLYHELKHIREKLTQDQLEFDMYADDPAGVTGIIGSSTGQLGGNLARQYNGPYIIRDIVATWATSSENPSPSVNGSGNATAPGADGTIASTPVLNPGTYIISWSVGLAGAAAAADANNFVLEQDTGPVTIVGSVNPGTAGQWQQLPVTVTLTAASTISVEAIGAGTAGVVYSAQIVATPATVQPTKVTLQLADRTFQLPAEPGQYALTDVAIKMQRDDQVVLTVTPAAACHLEIMGYAEKRRTDHA